MAALVKIFGIKQVIGKMMKASDATAMGIARGLKKGGLLLLRESKQIVPVQTGNLKASGFSRNVGGAGFSADIVVGYTAKYAVFVHEDMTKAHGKEFNVKHAQEIARAGRWSTSLKTGKTSFRPYGRAGTVEGGMFPRGEKQQAKYLEKPARELKATIMKMIHQEAKF